jgi:hypothetical protein
MAGAEVSQAARPMLQLRSAGAVRLICAGRFETGEDLQRAGGMHVMLQAFSWGSLWLALQDASCDLLSAAAPPQHQAELVITAVGASVAPSMPCSRRSQLEHPAAGPAEASHTSLHCLGAAGVPLVHAGSSDDKAEGALILLDQISSRGACRAH